MDERREWGSLVVVLLLVTVVGVSAVGLNSCGSGGGSDSNGGLCEQCGDTDGPCNLNGVDVSGDDRPQGCNDAEPCHVALLCSRKVDSGQRRCFPINPTTNQLDLRYECDGSRPAGTPVPTPTLTPTATPTPTNTAATPTSTGSPKPTATPGEEAEVTIVISNPTTEDLPSSFTGTVTYPVSKGSFLADGAVDCDEEDGLTPADNGSGTLTLTFSGDTGDDSMTFTCTFHQLAGQTLTHSDLSPLVTPNSLKITIDDL